jgi:hypothetical protein
MEEGHKKTRRRGGPAVACEEDLLCLQVVRSGRAAAVGTGQRHQRAETPRGEIEKRRLSIAIGR